MTLELNTWTGQRCLPMLSCPQCSSEMTLQGDSLVCRESGHTFGFDGNIPRLFCPNEWNGKSDITETMKAFYEKSPFPNYENIDSKWALLEKAEKGLFANLLNRQIPPGSKVLEAGCGTGQLTNYLGMAPNRAVFGSDMCLHSLRLAEGFRQRNEISNTVFLQMNLFRPVFKPETFDVVISNGVLHHTSDPYGGFVSILRLLKKGGIVIIGLYNTYGRLFTDIRRFIFRFSGQRMAFLDPHLNSIASNTAKRQAWFADQYQNPHESKHTMDEVLRWFDDNQVDFVNAVPKTSPFAPFSAEEQLFRQVSRETRLERLMVQLQMMASGSKEGGLFIMIGRKR